MSATATTTPTPANTTATTEAAPERPYTIEVFPFGTIPGRKRGVKVYPGHVMGDWLSDDEVKMQAYVEHLESELKKLRDTIGSPPTGSHPDEQNPRGATWHDERRHWIAETSQNRQHIAQLADRIAALEADVERMEPAYLREKAAKAVAETETVEAKPAAGRKGKQTS